MLKHIIFVIIYIIFYNIFSSEILLILLILHCLISIYADVTLKKYSVITLYYAVTILISVSNILLIGKIGDLTSTVYNYIAPQYIPEATLINCIGSSAIFIGFEAFRKKSFPKIDINITKKTLNIIFYIVVSYTLINIFISTITISFLGSGVANLLLLFNIFSIMVFARIWIAESNRKYGFYAIFLCVLETYLAIKTAYLRQALIMPLIALTAGYAIGLNNTKKIFSIRMVPFVIIFVLFLKLFATLGANRDNFIGILDNENNTEKEYSDAEKSTNTDKGNFFDRSSNLAQITNCVKLTKVNGFYEGKVSSILLIALVPRILWPDKPQIRLGVWFAIEIGVAYVNDEGAANNSINMTNAGELYLDFGWLGVVLGCIGIGVLFSLCWNAAHIGESAYNITGSLWAGYLLIQAFTNFGADLQIIITLMSTYLTFFIIKKIFRK